MAGKIQNMTEGSPAKLFIHLAMPVCIETTLWMLLSAAVNMIIGRGVGSEGLAAVGAATYPYNALNWLGFGVGQCIAGLIGIQYGIGDELKLRESVSTAILLAAAVGAVLAVAGIVSASPLLRLLHTTEDIFPATLRYLTVQYAAIPATTLHFALSYMLIAFGNGTDPLIDICILGGTAVSLSAFLIFILHAGVTAGAVALTCGYIAACCYDLHALHRMGVLSLKRGAFVFSGRTALTMLKKSLPYGVQLGISACAGLLMQRAVNAEGTAFVAGFAAALSACTILEGFQEGCGHAINSYVSQNYGARKPERIRQGIRTALLIGIVISAFYVVLYVFLGRPLLRLYIDPSDPNAGAATQTALFMLRFLTAASYPLYLLYIFRTALVGMGRSTAAGFGTACEIIGRGFTAILFPVILGLPGVLFSEGIAWSMSGFCHLLVFVILFRKEFPRRS